MDKIFFTNRLRFQKCAYLVHYIYKRNTFFYLQKSDYFTFHLLINLECIKMRRKLCHV